MKSSESEPGLKLVSTITLEKYKGLHLPFVSQSDNTAADCYHSAPTEGTVSSSNNANNALG